MNKPNAQLFRTPVKRKSLGAIHTPQPVADAVVKFVAKYLPNRKITVFEPSCGDGAFVKSVCDALPHTLVQAIDIDQEAIDFCEERYPNVLFECTDFFDIATQRPELGFDLIVGNPPYIRASNFSDALRNHIDELARRLNFPRSKLPNSWPAFVIACSELVNAGGALALVLPYELITTKYAKPLMSKLLGEFRQVQVFISEEKAFKEIDQDAVILIASEKGQRSTELHIHKVKSLSQLSPINSSVVPATIAEVDSSKIHSHILSSEQLELADKIRSKMSKIGDHCTCVAGTVTAANKFFILSDKEVNEHNLTEFARPILQKSAYIGPKNFFDDADFQSLRDSGKPCYIIDFSKIHFDELPIAAQTYVRDGEAQGLNMRYKCRNRTPWYRIPIVPSGDGFFFKRSHLIPKICENRANVLTTDAAYQIKMINEHRIQDLCRSFFNSVTLLFSEMDGRFYGGGVLELTPNEFRGLPIELLKRSENTHSGVKASYKLSMRQHLQFDDTDEHIRQRLGMNELEFSQLKIARTLLQNHRLRHGSGNGSILLGRD